MFIEFQIVICKTLSVWKSLKCVVWERVKDQISNFVLSFVELHYAAKATTVVKVSSTPKYSNSLSSERMMDFWIPM